MKKCTRCTKDKDIKEFGNVKRSKDGLDIYCRLCRSEITRDWRESNPERVKEIKTKSLENNPGKAAEAVKKWRSNNLPRWNEISRIWAKNNPDNIRAIRAKRRALINGADSPLTNEEWQEILEDFNYLCFWCGAPWEEQEHLIPLQPRPGNRKGTHSKENVVPSCKTCNQRKHNKDPLDFLIEITEKENIWIVLD